ncbi:MAG: hypothetical protein P8183_20855, partial [Anaerolineae bacterium]
MIARVFSWSWNRFRPEAGWLPFFLLITAEACLLTAVSEVQWVPESHVIIPAGLWGLLLGILLAQRPLRALPAWLLITIYGGLFVVIWLGHLSPPLKLWVSDWPAFGQYVRQNSALFADRMGSWLVAVFSGSRSQETIGFALGIGLGAWFSAAFAAWSVFRLRRPLPGLAVMGVALALNGYFGDASLQWMVFFIGLAVMVT